jgi:diaminohydroxyphosphoribosylaminopyrimidine deaminase/5-amino-6-(5-phosphoribosylamino)uracil reductase
MAPKLLGDRAMPMLELGFDKMLEALSLDIVDVRALGQDWRITAQPVYE